MQVPGFSDFLKSHFSGVEDAKLEWHDQIASAENDVEQTAKKLKKLTKIS